MLICLYQFFYKYLFIFLLTYEQGWTYLSSLVGTTCNVLSNGLYYNRATIVIVMSWIILNFLKIFERNDQAI